MPSLFSEKNTVFDHSVWDRYEYVTLLRQHRTLNEQDFYQRDKFNYSLQQDGFYALNNLALIPDSANQTVQFWAAVQRTPWFKQLQKIFRQDETGRRVAVKSLAQITQDYVANDPSGLSAAEQRQAQQEIEQIRQALEQAYRQGQPQDQDDDQGDGQEKPEQSQGQGQGEDGQGKDSESSTGENQSGEAPESLGQGESTQGQAQPSGQSQHPAAQSQMGTAAQGQTQPSQPTAQNQTGVGRFSEQPDPQSIAPLKKPNLPGLPDKLKFNDPVDPLASGPSAASLADDQHKAINGLLPYLRPDQRNDEQILDKLNQLTGDLDVGKLAKFLGFAQRAVAGAHHEADAAGGELTKYRNTTWSEKLHPVDLAGLARGDARTQVRLAEGGLRERRYENKAPRGRGPVVVLRDETGSMSGDKHDSARALEIALAHAFNQDQRDLVSIAWGGGTIRTCIYGQDDVLAHLTRWISGNYTQIEQGLREAVKVAQEYRDGADILIVSDGTIEDAQYSSVKALAESFHQANGRIWVVLACTADDIRWMERAAERIGRKGTVQNYLSWADGVIHLRDLSNSEKLSQLITAMNRREINLKGKKVAV